jgi:hypothetical protein
MRKRSGWDRKSPQADFLFPDGGDQHLLRTGEIIVISSVSEVALCKGFSGNVFDLAEAGFPCERQHLGRGEEADERRPTFARALLGSVAFGPPARSDGFLRQSRSELRLALRERIKDPRREANTVGRLRWPF